MVNTLDRVIGYFSPKRGAERAAYRIKADLLNGVRNYEGASTGRLAKGWNAPRGNADTHIARSGQILRDRSRELVRNNPLAAKIVTVHANHFVGPGIVPRAKTGDLERDEAINTLFDEWSNVCHVDGATTFYGLSYLMARMVPQDGECFIRRRRRRISDGLPVPVQLQLLDSEFCDWSKSRIASAADENPINLGIEYDRIGRRRGYWMFPYHPYGPWPAGRGGNGSAFVPADDIAHIFEAQTNQIRGVPWLAPVMTELKDLRDYELAENIRKKSEACMVGVITRAAPDGDPILGQFEPGGEDSSGQNAVLTDMSGNSVERMEPGAWYVGEPGSKVEFNTPSISAGIEAYIRTRQRSIAAGSRMPYSLMTGDFSQDNFASGQLGLLDYETFVEAIQWHFLIPQGLQRIWDWFVQAGREVGKIGLGEKVGVEWQPPEFKKLNRLDEAKADLLEMRIMKRSPQEVIAKTGRDPMTVLQEFDAWFSQVDKTGSKLVSDADPRKTSVNGQAQNANENKEGSDSAKGS